MVDLGNASLEKEKMPYNKYDLVFSYRIKEYLKESVTWWYFLRALTKATLRQSTSSWPGVWKTVELCHLLMVALVLDTTPAILDPFLVGSWNTSTPTTIKFPILAGMLQKTMK